MNPQPTIITTNDAGRFAWERNDCCVVATALASGLHYADAHRRFWTYGRDVRRRTKIHTLRAALSELRADVFQPRPRITLARFVLEFPRGRYACKMHGHLFAVIDGVVYDSAGIVRPGSRVTMFWEFPTPPASPARTSRTR